MALKVQQGVVIYSQQIMCGEKLQALISDIVPEYIDLYIPLENVDIKQGIDLFVNFWDDHATYEFASKVLSPKSKKEFNLKIGRPYEIKKVMNRSFPRVDLNAQGLIYASDSLEKDRCIIDDISAGGTMITAQSGWNVTDLVKLAFTLPDNEKFEDVSGKIVWKKDIVGGATKYGVEFDNISEIRRQKIVRFVNSHVACKDPKQGEQAPTA